MSFERDREISSDVLFYYERFKFALSQRLYPPERERPNFAIEGEKGRSM